MSGETDAVTNGSFLVRRGGGCVDVREEKQLDQVHTGRRNESNLWTD